MPTTLYALPLPQGATAFAVVVTAGNITVASDFGTNGSAVVYVDGSSDPAQDFLFFNTIPGAVTANFASFTVYQTSKNITYGAFVGYGYWFPTNNPTGIPATVTATFTQLPNGQASVNVTVTGYYSGAPLFQSGTQALIGAATGLVITPGGAS